MLGSTNVQVFTPSAPERMISAERPGPSGASGPHQMAASTTSPSTLTHWVWESRGSAAWSMPGGDLDTESGHGLTQREYPRQSRRPLLRISDAPPLGPAGRVGEDGVHPSLGQVDLKGVGALDACMGGRA